MSKPVKSFSVRVEFIYHSDEDISEWNTDVPHTHVTTKDEAIATAIAEIEANGASSLSFDVIEV